MNRTPEQEKAAQELEEWLETLPLGPPLDINDPDPLMRKAARWFYSTGQATTSQPSKSGTPTPTTTDGSGTAST